MSRPESIPTLDAPNTIGTASSCDERFAIRTLRVPATDVTHSLRDALRSHGSFEFHH